MNIKLNFIIGLFVLAALFFMTRQNGFVPLINHMSFYPDRHDTIEADKLPANVKEVFITTSDGLEIHSYFLPDESSSKIVIFFHGNAGNLAHRLPDLMQLNLFGINVLGVEYRGYGKSQGRPSERGINLDGQAAYDYAINELGFSDKNVILFGRSIGSTVAVNTAQDRNINGLILASPLTSAKAHAKFAGLGLFQFLAGNAFNNLDKIDNIKCPLLVIHGTDDRVIPFAMGQELYKAAKVKKQFVEIPGANHNNLSDSYAKPYWQAINDFINES